VRLRGFVLAVGLLALGCRTADPRQPERVLEASAAQPLAGPTDGSIPASSGLTERVPPAEDAGTLSPPDGSLEAPIESTPKKGPCDVNIESDECRDSFPAVPACPATFAELRVGQLCGLTARTKRVDCNYREGRCRCAPLLSCGGVAPPNLMAKWMGWNCRPPARPGDCPEQAPAPGSSCQTPGQTCEWPGCTESTRCTCQAKGWRCVTSSHGPPP